MTTKDQLHRLPEPLCAGDALVLRVGRRHAIIRMDSRAGLMTVVRILPRDRAYRE